jgi:methanogenic corrinoid protein MtbC1
MVPSELTVKLGDLDLEGVLADVQRLIDSGAAPLDVLRDLQEGMLIVGRRFEAEDYFLSELIYSAEIFKQATALFGDTLQ